MKKKAISLLLAWSMALTMVSTGLLAAGESYLDQLKAADGTVTLDGVNAGSVTVSVVGTGAMKVYGLDGAWDLSDTSGKIQLSGMGSDVMTFEGTN